MKQLINQLLRTPCVHGFNLWIKIETAEELDSWTKQQHPYGLQNFQWVYVKIISSFFFSILSSKQKLLEPSLTKARPSFAQFWKLRHLEKQIFLFFISNQNNLCSKGYLSWNADLKSPELQELSLAGWSSEETINAQSVLSYRMCRKGCVFICSLSTHKNRSNFKCCSEMD